MPSWVLNQDKKLKIKSGVIALFTILGLVVGFLDILLDYLYLHEGKGPFLYFMFIETPIHQIFWLVMLLLFISFGVIISRVLIKQKESESALQKAHDELEKRVSLRTVELTNANDRLTVELLERQRVEKALMESEKQLRHLSFQLEMAQETERRRISRELHDELGQDLTVMKMKVRFIQKHLPDNNQEIVEESENLLHYIGQVIENVRRLSRDLSPSILEDLGLSAALRWLISSFAKNNNMRLILDIIDLDHMFAKSAQIMIYRVFQEALTNMGKHAQAKEISVVIVKDQGRDEMVCFTIEDNGKGFDVDSVVMSVDSDKGLGLATMKERVKMLRGVIAIESQKGKGTKIAFKIPRNRPGDRHEPLPFCIG